MTKESKNKPKQTPPDVNSEESSADETADKMKETEEQKAQNKQEPEESDAAEVEETIAEVSKEEEDIRSRMMRLQADFENYKKRTLKEKNEVFQYATESFVTKLLPVLDNLDRAEAAAEADNDQSNYRSGVKMVFKELLEILEAEGLKEIITEEATFDPNFHHGVAVGDDPEKPDQVILEAFQKGYMFKDKVIRPSMVKVNQR